MEREEDEDALVKDGHAAEDRIESRWERRRPRRESRRGITMRAIESRTGSGVNDSRLELVHSK